MDWLMSFGYWGLFLGAFLAGTVFPLSSDILLNGALAIGMSPWISMGITTTANWLGLLSTYGLGWIGKWEWLEKYGKVSREQLHKQKTVIEKYGVWIALFTWIPVVGIIGLIALGFYKVKPGLTMLLLFVACITRFTFWTVMYVNYGYRVIEWITG